MRTIRQSIFETNSSSTHAICIAPTYNINKTEVEFGNGEFGWEVEVYRNLQTRLDYLHEMIKYNQNYEENKQKIKDILAKHNVHCKFNDGEGYIDHCEDTNLLCNLLVNNEEILLRYLFGDTYIITGNDNSDGYDDLMQNYIDSFAEYDIFEKGN